MRGSGGEEELGGAEGEKTIIRIYYVSEQKKSNSNKRKKSS